MKNKKMVKEKNEEKKRRDKIVQLFRRGESASSIALKMKTDTEEVLDVLAKRRII
jgi:hypothetical protein